VQITFIGDGDEIGGMELTCSQKAEPAMIEIPRWTKADLDKIRR
jgi:hypothetical protein